MSEKEDQGEQNTSPNLFLALLKPKEFIPNVGFLRLYQTPLSLATGVILLSVAALFLFFRDQQDFTLLVLLTAMPGLLAAMLIRVWFTEYRRMKSISLSTGGNPFHRDENQR